VSFLAKRTLIHGLHCCPISPTLRFNLATLLREQNHLSSRPACVDVLSLRQLVANLQLHCDHIPTHLAIAADECDRGNVLSSELYLVNALYQLRERRLPLRNALNHQVLQSNSFAMRTLILTNIAVLHQRGGKFRSAERRYRQIAEINCQFSEVQLKAHALWCESTNIAAISFAGGRRVKGEIGATLQHALEATML